MPALPCMGKVLKRTLSPERYEKQEDGEWRNEGLHNSYLLPLIHSTNQIKKEECSTHLDMTHAHKILVGNPEGKRQL